MFCTSVFWYLIVSFVHWDIAWVTEIPKYENFERLIMFMFIIIKCIIDAAIYLLYIENALKKDGLL